MKKAKAILKKLVTLDYRHYICVTLTICFVVLGVFVFPNTVLRLAEACRDVGTSAAYMFCEFFLDENNVAVTVNKLPEWKFNVSSYTPIEALPFTWDEFLLLWQKYWKLFFNLQTFLYYVIDGFSVIFSIYTVVVSLFILSIPLKIVTEKYLKNHNVDYDRESRAVVIIRLVASKTYRPVKKWIIGFIIFIKENKAYYLIWLILWGLYFNVWTILYEVLAYSLYFLVSFDFFNLYRQVYKLMLDLTNVVRFVPGAIWVIAFLVVLELWARHIGYNRLDKNECRNSAFVGERGVVTVVYGPMGAGKTKLITDMSLSAEVRLRDMAFEIILESDLKFPNMNWATFEQELKRAISEHIVFSLYTVKKWLKKKYRAFMRDKRSANLFGYNYEYYGLEYNDGLRTYNIWETMLDYGQAYLIYTVLSSLIQSNYSIRVDDDVFDMGNFPVRNMDFFRRDSRLMESYSRHTHILDFDLLRLGKRLLADNPHRYAFGFGVFVISEIDKERKNDKELRDNEVMAKAKEANQRNDLFNALLKMSRHACVVANRVFVKVFADLQRPESLGADARELGEVVYISKRAEVAPVLPFFAPFYIFDLLFSLLFGKFVKLYQKYRVYRGDKTAPMYLLKNLVAFGKNVCDKTNNLYNSSTVKLEVESGRMGGDSVERKYFEQSKKIYSKRYSTDCLKGVFEQYAELNTVGTDDLPEYANIIATEFELLKQNSFFQKEVRSYNKDVA